MAEQPVTNQQEEQPKEPGSVMPDLRKLFNHQWVMKNIGFFFFLAILGVIYIYVGHTAEKLARKIASTEKHIKELEYEYKTIKSEVIFRSKATELIKAVEKIGLKELTTPPVYLSDSAAH